MRKIAEFKLKSTEYYLGSQMGVFCSHLLTVIYFHLLNNLHLSYIIYLYPMKKICRFLLSVCRGFSLWNHLYWDIWRIILINTKVNISRKKKKIGKNKLIKWCWNFLTSIQEKNLSFQKNILLTTRKSNYSALKFILLLL